MRRLVVDAEFSCRLQGCVCAGCFGCVGGGPMMRFEDQRQQATAAVPAAAATAGGSSRRPQAELSPRHGSGPPARHPPASPWHPPTVRRLARVLSGNLALMFLMRLYARPELPMSRAATHTCSCTAHTAQGHGRGAVGERRASLMREEQACSCTGTAAVGRSFSRRRGSKGRGRTARPPVPPALRSAAGMPPQRTHSPPHTSSTHVHPAAACGCDCVAGRNPG